MTMEFMAMRSLSRELPTVLSQLQRDGELVVTNNGQPTILMIDLVGRDLVDVVGRFRKSQAAPATPAGNARAWLKFVDAIDVPKQQNEALKRLAACLKEIDDEPFDEEFDTIMAKRVNFNRELDL